MSTVESLTATQIRKEIADAVAAASGGASVGGTTVCDMWNLTKQFNGAYLIAHPSGGFDFRKLNGGGPRMGFKLGSLPTTAEDPTYGWTQGDPASLIVGDSGWFTPTLWYQLSFYNNPPKLWNVNFTYPGQDYGNYPSFNIEGPLTGRTYQQSWTYNPIHLNAGDEIQLQAQSVGGDNGAMDASSLGNSQFCLSFTTLSLEDPGTWSPDPADTSIHFIP